MAKRKSFSINRSLSQGLEETINAAHGYSGELFVDVVPISRLELDPSNPRDLHLSFSDISDGIADSDEQVVLKRKELESLRSLSESINNQGVINPVVVYKHDNNYRLVAGERRTLASLLAGRSSIEARILESRPDPLKKTILQWMENVEREDLALYERLDNLNDILAAFSKTSSKKPERITAAELSNLTGISNSQASQYKVVLQGSDELLAAIHENKVANLDKAAFIAKAPYSQQSMLITLCEQGSTLRDMKKSIDSVTVHDKQHTTQERAPSFKATIRNPEVARMIMESMLSHDNFAHLFTKFPLGDEMTEKQFNQFFHTFLKELESELSDQVVAV